MKRMHIIALLLAMVVWCCAPAFASAQLSTGLLFHDVDPSTPAGNAIYKMAAKGYVSGMGNGFFEPTATLTRAQFVKMVNQSFSYTVKGENVFSDVHPDDWYYDDVTIARQMGYIEGVGDGLFAPESTVTREQVCVILNRILTFAPLPFDQVVADEISDWAKQSVYALLSNRLMELEQNNTFRATQPMTREETCLLLAQFIVEEVVVTVPDIHTMVKEELEMRLTRVANSLEHKVVPALSSEQAKEVALAVRANMLSYLADNTHDYKKAAAQVYETYKALPVEDKKQLQQLIQENNWTDDIILLYAFFFEVDE